MEVVTRKYYCADDFSQVKGCLRGGWRCRILRCFFWGMLANVQWQLGSLVRSLSGCAAGRRGATSQPRDVQSLAQSRDGGISQTQA